MPLRVLLYGDFSWDRLGPSYQRAFEQLGHRVIPFDTREARVHLAPWLKSRMGHRLTIRSLSFRQAGSRRWNERFVEAVQSSQPDLVLILNGSFLFPGTLTKVRSLGVKTFIFHADNPFPGYSSSRPEDLYCARQCDCYFIWSRSLAARLVAAGVSRVEYLPFAWDAEVFPYRTPTPRPLHDLVFIGGWDRERESWLAHLAGRFNLKIWGPDYWGTRTRSDSPLRRCWQGQAAVGAELVRIVSESKIVLNLLRTQNLPDGTNMRTFEIPGCGGFLLSTRSDGAMEIFPVGNGGAYFSSIDECCAKVDAYLLEEKPRREIAKRAHEIVQNHQCYTHRAQQIIGVYESLRPIP